MTYFRFLPIAACSILFGALPASAADISLPASDTVRADTLVEGGVLKNLVVDGQRVLRYPDKDVWIISRSMRRHAFDVVGMLGNIPGMYYDRFDRKLSYNGMGKIKLLMDGKEKEDFYIKNLSHMRFKRVEITTHPQGIYRDYDVLVNLVSYENYEGVELLVRTTAEAKPEQDENPSEVKPSMTFTYTRDKLNIAAYYRYWYYLRQRYDVGIQRIYPDYHLTTFAGAGPVDVNRINYHTGYIDADYDFNSRHSVSLRYSYTDRNSHLTDDYMVEKDYDNSDWETTLRRELTLTLDRSHDHVATLYYRGRVGKWSLYSDFNYNYSTSDNSYEFDEHDGIHFLNAYKHHKHLTRLNLSASRMLNKRTSLNMGYVNTYRYYKSSNGTYTSTSDEFRHRAFASLGYTFSSKLGGRVNVDAELLQDKYGDVTKNRCLWSVNVNMNYRYQSINNMYVGYNCSVNYPYQFQLNPISYITGYGVVVAGNPSLKANKTHMFSFGINRSLRSIFLSLNTGLSYSGNYIQNLTTRDNDGNLMMTYHNMEHLRPFVRVNMDGHGYFDAGRKYSYRYTFSVAYNYDRYRLQAFGVDDSGGNLNGSLSMGVSRNFNETIGMGAVVGYKDNGNGYAVSPQSRYRDELKVLNFGLTLNNYRLNIEGDIQYRLPLRGGHHDIYYREYMTPTYCYYVNRNMFESEHKLSLNLRWRFAAGWDARRNKKHNGQYTEYENNNMLR